MLRHFATPLHTFFVLESFCGIVNRNLLWDRYRFSTRFHTKTTRTRNHITTETLIQPPVLPEFRMKQSALTNMCRTRDIRRHGKES